MNTIQSTKCKSFLFPLQAVLEIHDEVAAQIQNCQEDFEYIDGVSSIADDDLAGGGGGHGRKSRLSSLPEDRDGETKEEEELEEIKVDTFRVIGVRRKQGECLVREIIVFITLTVGRRIYRTCVPVM